MDELRKLVQIIESRGTEEVQLLEFTSKKNKEWKLYEGIIQGKVKTDEDAINFIYNDKISLSGYKMLKSRLRKKLMNKLFFLDLHGSSFRTSLAQELECYAKIYQAKALINSGEFEISIPILKQVLIIADKFGYNDIIDICNRSLLSAYAYIDDKTNFYKTKASIESNQKKITADFESEYDYLEAKIELSRSVSSRKAYMNKMYEKVQVLEKRWIENRSFSTFHHYYMLSIWYNELQGNWDSIINSTQKSEELLIKYDLNVDRFDLRYNRYMIIYAYLRTKRYEEGLKLANLYEPFFSPVTINWFAYMEHYFLLALHSKRYDLAHSVLQRVQENPFFKKIQKLAQERWTLFEAYLQFVTPTSSNSLQLQAIVQNLPSYSKDKEGYNVAILILQVMYYLQKADVEALTYRTEALKKYALKHFKNEFSERSRLFFKLLTVMVQADFDPIMCEKKGKNIFTSLCQTPFPSEGYIEIEIVPYEHLWELILHKLNQFDASRK